jgi:hypothetical protein
MIMGRIPMTSQIKWRCYLQNETLDVLTQAQNSALTFDISVQKQRRIYCECVSE